MSIFINMSNVYLDRSVIFGSDETAGCGATNQPPEHREIERKGGGDAPFTRNIEIDNFSLILK